MKLRGSVLCEVWPHSLSICSGSRMPAANRPSVSGAPQNQSAKAATTARVAMFQAAPPMPPFCMKTEVTTRHQPDFAGSASNAPIAPDQQSWRATPPSAIAVSATAAQGIRRAVSVFWPTRARPPLNISTISAAVVTLNRTMSIVTTPSEPCAIY